MVKYYYIPKHLYVECLFDIELLPMQLNLPMVCKPLDWEKYIQFMEDSLEPARTLSDLSGGYLSRPTGELYNRYRLLSSSNENHFFIEFRA